MAGGPNQDPIGRASIWLVGGSPVAVAQVQQAFSRRAGLRIFADADAALEQIERGVLPDLLILDWAIPDRSVELAACARATWNKDMLPILAITVAGSGAAAIGAGANDFL